MNEKPGSSIAKFLQEEARSLDLRSALRRIAEHAGMKFFVFGMFPDVARPGLIDNTIETNWPSELMRRYAGADLLSSSPLIGRMKTTSLPVSGSLLLAGGTQGNPHLDEGFASSVALTAFDLKGSRYVYLLSGARPDGFCESKGSIHLELLGTIEKFYPGPVEQHSLTSREIECLKWSAAGKSSGETAMILGLSAYTVDGYLRDAMRKLDSVTRVQAVAKAIRSGLV